MAKNEKDYINELLKLKAELDSFLMSENEANEIIVELKADNERLKEEMTELEEKFLTLNGKSYSYYMTLQEIKTIAERQLLVTNVRTYQMVYYADFSEYRNEILEKITKAEEE